MMTYSDARPLVDLTLPDNRTARLALMVFWAVVGTLILTISAKAKVVLGPVDMSLQTLAILLIGASLGARLGSATLLLYLAEGALGFPVFQSTPEKGLGIAYMMGPTGGFLVGFVAMAAIAGWAADRGWDRNLFKLFGAMLLAEVVLMGLGFAWLAGLIGVEAAWLHGVLPFILVDLLKVALAAMLITGVRGLFSWWRH